MLMICHLCITQQYFQSSDRADSKLTIEWTNQHGCGGNEDDDPNKLNCNIVIQYMVSDVCDAGTLKENYLVCQ